jgi:hypothetical protein
LSWLHPLRKTEALVLKVRRHSITFDRSESSNA